MSAPGRSPALSDAAVRLRLLGYLQRDARRRSVPVERVIDERARAERRAPFEGPAPQGSLADYIRREFLPTKQQDWSKRGDARAAWRTSARGIALELADSELGRLPFVGLQRRDVKRWWAGIKGRVDAGQWSRETANKRLTMLRSIYNFALDDEHAGLTANPTTRIKKLRIDPTTLPTEHFASDAERERVIKVAGQNPRLHAAVLLAAFYGLRRASVCDLQVRDVNFQAGTIGWATKTGQRLVRPLHPRVREALAGLAEGRRPNESLLGYGDYIPSRQPSGVSCSAWGSAGDSDSTGSVTISERASSARRGTCAWPKRPSATLASHKQSGTLMCLRTR